MSHPIFIQQDMEIVFQIISPEYCLIDRSTGLLLYTMTYLSKPKFVLEIGRYRGCSTCFLSGALTDIDQGGLLFSVDIENQISEDTLYFLSSTRLVQMDSKNLLSNPDIANKKFGIIYIDGDHNYDAVVQDLDNTYKVSDESTLWILDDYDLVAVKKAVETFRSKHIDIVDRGTYNSKIKILSRTV
jgi:predicted O-methyltransferase YrrM